MVAVNVFEHLTLVWLVLSLAGVHANVLEEKEQHKQQEPPEQKGDEAGQLSDECSHARVDRCARTLVPYSVNETLPIDEAEIDAFCNEQKSDLRCFEAFEKGQCVHGITMAVFRAAREGTTDEIESRCIKGSPRREDYAKYTACINTVGGKLTQCSQRMLRVFAAASVHTSKKERIPYGCCHFDAYLACVKGVVKAACSPEHVEYAETLVHNMSGNVLSLACGGYSHRASACKRLRKLPPVNSEHATFIGALLETFAPLG